MSACSTSSSLGNFAEQGGTLASRPPSDWDPDVDPVIHRPCDIIDTPFHARFSTKFCCCQNAQPIRIITGSLSITRTLKINSSLQIQRRIS
eukprot:IDg13909t1